MMTIAKKFFFAFFRSCGTCGAQHSIQHVSRFFKESSDMDLAAARVRGILCEARRFWQPLSRTPASISLVSPALTCDPVVAKP